jgi:hypothetical protein
MTPERAVSYHELIPRMKAQQSIQQRLLDGLSAERVEEIYLTAFNDPELALAAKRIREEDDLERSNQPE